jgi:hypothetical protein
MEGSAPPLCVAVDDLGAGLWGGRLKRVRGDSSAIHGLRSGSDLIARQHSDATLLLQELEARLPLRNVLFSLSRAVVSVEDLNIR